MMNIKRTAEDAAAGEDPDELYLGENVFRVPKEARWSHLQANAKQPSIGQADRRGDGRDRGGDFQKSRNRSGESWVYRTVFTGQSPVFFTVDHASPDPVERPARYAASGLQ